MIELNLTEREAEAIIAAMPGTQIAKCVQAYLDADKQAKVKNLYIVEIECLHEMPIVANSKEEAIQIANAWINEDEPSVTSLKCVGQVTECPEWAEGVVPYGDGDCLTCEEYL
jgi:hypothetical protein